MEERNRTTESREKRLPNWIMEVRAADSALEETVQGTKIELSKRIKPSNEEIKTRFFHYIDNLAPHLPEAILFLGYPETSVNIETFKEMPFRVTKLPVKYWFLPKSQEVYWLTVSLGSSSTFEELDPSNERFIGFDEARTGKNVRLANFKEAKNILHEEDMKYIADQSAKSLEPNLATDPKIVEAKEGFYVAITRRDEELKRVKEELAPSIKQRVMNTRDILANHFGKNRFPEYVEPIWYHKPNHIGKAFYFLPREGRLVEAPRKKSLLPLGGPKPDFSKARDATLEEWYNFGYDFGKNMLLLRPKGLMPLGWARSIE